MALLFRHCLARRRPVLCRSLFTRIHDVLETQRNSPRFNKTISCGPFSSDYEFLVKAELSPRSFNVLMYDDLQERARHAVSAGDKTKFVRAAEDAILWMETLPHWHIFHIPPSLLMYEHFCGTKAFEVPLYMMFDRLQMRPSGKNVLALHGKYSRGRTFLLKTLCQITNVLLPHDALFCYVNARQISLCEKGTLFQYHDIARDTLRMCIQRGRIPILMVDETTDALKYYPQFGVFAQYMAAQKDALVILADNTRDFRECVDNVFENKKVSYVYM